VCPVDAIAVDGPVVRIDDALCVRSGQCVGACPHDAIDALGDLDRARELAATGTAVMILSGEAAVHFFPHTPEQVVNACYRAGFMAVHHGVFGDELVAAEYARVLEEPGWGTLIRSTCPVLVERIRRDYPELVPYLAPIVTPLEAEASYLRAVYGEATPLVYAGVCFAGADACVDAVLTFEDLDTLFERTGIRVADEPQTYRRIPGERRRHMSAAGGMPLPLLQREGQASQRFRKFRGLKHLESIRHAVAVDRIDLGFVDILPCEGCLDHPLLGEQEELFWRRRVVEESEPPRSPLPVVDEAVVVRVDTAFSFVQDGHAPPEDAVEAVLRQIGTAPNGAPWNCGACGYGTCRQFARAYLQERATFRQCPPYQERRAEEALQQAAVDELTGLATYRVLKDRLAHEVARSRRSGEPFAVLFLDMDSFKRINDTFGHQSGSGVLAAVGREMLQALRSTDVAARYGGDEFVIVLIRTERSGALRVAEVVRQRIESVGAALGYAPGVVTASIGVAAFEPSTISAVDVLEQADRALYLAKARGGNCVA